MATQPQAEVVLYDLASTKNVCFSPIVWRIRLMLNYKRIPYETIFLEFPDIEPTLKELDIAPPLSSQGRYTVPAIHHLPSNTKMMDSLLIAHFLEAIYPRRMLTLSSPLGSEIIAQTRAISGAAYRASITPRETHVLCPRSQAYFRRTREAALGHPLEELLDLETEDEVWAAAEAGMGPVGELMKTHRVEGPFILGAKPSWDDFVIVGSVLTARVVEMGVFERLLGFPGYAELYEACKPLMAKED